MCDMKTEECISCKKEVRNKMQGGKKYSGQADE